MARHFTTLEKQAWVKKFKESGESLVAFSRQENLNFRTLSSWISKLENNQSSSSSSSSKVSDNEDDQFSLKEKINFVPIRLAKEQSSLSNEKGFLFKGDPHDCDPYDSKREGERGASSSSFICLKTKGYTLEIPLDISFSSSMDSNQNLIPGLIKILHELS